MQCNVCRAGQKKAVSAVLRDSPGQTRQQQDAVEMGRYDESCWYHSNTQTRRMYNADDRIKCCFTQAPCYIAAYPSNHTISHECHFSGRGCRERLRTNASIERQRLWQAQDVVSEVKLQMQLFCMQGWLNTSMYGLCKLHTGTAIM